ncbi:MAG: GspH/FimT family pseudopilin [Gammaproteobacteria bacterium]
MHLPKHTRVRKKETGLSLLELLITVAVAFLLLGAGVPGFRHLVLESRMTGAVNNLVRDLHFARQTANARAAPVMVCPIAAGGRCRTDGQWQGGWQVMTRLADSGPSGEFDQVLRREPGLMNINILSNRRVFVFRPFTLRDTNGTIAFCDERGIDASRALVISPSGRPRLASRPETRRKVHC